MDVTHLTVIKPLAGSGGLIRAYPELATAIGDVPPVKRLLERAGVESMWQADLGDVRCLGPGRAGVVIAAQSSLRTESEELEAVTYLAGLIGAALAELDCSLVANGTGGPSNLIIPVTRTATRSPGRQSRPGSDPRRRPRVSQATRRSRSPGPTASQQAVLADLGRRALGDDVQTLLEAAAGQVTDVLDAHRCCIAEVEPDGERLRLIAEARQGGNAGCRRTAWIPVGAMLARHAIRTSETVISGDGAAAAAIAGSERMLGAIFVGSERSALEPSVPAFLRAIAATLALAIERALTQQRLAAARELERRRIARDLHDDGLRELTKALGIATRGLLAATEPPDRRQWEQQTVALQRLTRHLRAAIYDLRRGTREDCAFADLLSQLVAAEAELTEGRRVELHGREALPAGSLGERGSETLAIVRESVTNARRHSGAMAITVDAAASTPECLKIDISDDGSWPERGVACTRRGAGILGMHERADKLRGTLSLEPRAGGGTTVSLRVPLGGPAPT